MLDDLVSEANSAAAIERPKPVEAPAPRPAAMSGGPAKSRTSSGPASLAGGLAKGAGKFMLGCIFSFVGAMVGAGVWCGIAVGTGVELGYCSQDAASFPLDRVGRRGAGYARRPCLAGERRA